MEEAKNQPTTIEELVRDLTTVHPRPKSEVRRMIEVCFRQMIERAKPAGKYDESRASNSDARERYEYTGYQCWTTADLDEQFENGAMTYHTNLLRELENRGINEQD